MRQQVRTVTLVAVFIVALTACGAPQAAAPTQSPPSATLAPSTPEGTAPTTTPTTAPTSLPPPTTPSAVPSNSTLAVEGLPGAVYLIEAASGQVVRLEADGVTQTPITFEPEPIRALTVSTAGGIVYLIGLDATAVLVSLDGSGRRELATGTISYPRISPDGQQVIYRLDDPQPGLIIGQDAAPSGVYIQASSGMRPSLVRADEPAGVYDVTTPAWAYSPVDWSPDGSRIALFAYDADGPAIPGGDLVILDPTGATAEVRSLTCCEAERWSADGRVLTMAGGGPGPDLRYGLYQIDAATGAETTILAVDETTTPLVIAPQQLADGLIYAFVELVSDQYIDWEYAFTPALAQVSLDGSVTPLRRADLTPYEVIWDARGRGALITFDPDFTDIDTYAGQLAWLAVGATEPLRLPISGSTIHWAASAPLAVGDCAAFAPLSFQPPATRNFDPNIRDLQARLTAQGFAAGPADGFFGEQTRSALEAFQTEMGLPVTGDLDCASWQALLQ